jgi:hypothetical protein
MSSTSVTTESTKLPTTTQGMVHTTEKLSTPSIRLTTAPTTEGTSPPYVDNLIEGVLDSTFVCAVVNLMEGVLVPSVVGAGVNLIVGVLDVAVVGAVVNLPVISHELGKNREVNSSHLIFSKSTYKYGYVFNICYNREHEIANNHTSDIWWACSLCCRRSG